MVDDPIRKYSQAMEELGRATERVQGMQHLIKQIASALDRPYELMVSNVGVGFPPEVAMARVPTLNADNWPTAKQIAEALANLHEKRSQVDLTWASLSQADKNLVNPPPDK
jgi:hypothetical protein